MTQINTQVFDYVNIANYWNINCSDKTNGVSGIR